ncbi:hypothetical protein LZ30DRAFT_723105 [Colletotrichum cereale]|nr:hypothetical protein LZ30DRAFT_723105 [Colletotrichum cereale]
MSTSLPEQPSSQINFNCRIPSCAHHKSGDANCADPPQAGRQDPGFLERDLGEAHDLHRKRNATARVQEGVYPYKPPMRLVVACDELSTVSETWVDVYSRARKCRLRHACNLYVFSSRKAFLPDQSLFCHESHKGDDASTDRLNEDRCLSHAPYYYRGTTDMASDRADTEFPKMALCPLKPCFVKAAASSRPVTARTDGPTSKSQTPKNRENRLIWNARSKDLSANGNDGPVCHRAVGFQLEPFSEVERALFPHHRSKDVRSRTGSGMYDGYVPIG